MIHPLRLRAFRLLFLGRTLSALGDAVVPAALALAVLRVTGSSSALALVLGCAMVPKLLLLPLGGVLADRLDARIVAIGTDLVRCVVQVFIGVELLGDDPTLVSIAVASAVGGVASAFAMPTTSPLVAGVVDAAGRQQANAALGAARSVTGLAGPALAGALIWAAGPGWAFVLDGASFAVSAALLAVLRVRRVPVQRQTLLADLREGWSEVRSRDWYWSSLVAHAVWNGVAAVLVTLGPAIAVDRLGGEGVWVLVLQAGAVGLLLGSLLAGRARLRRPILVANLGLATYALPLILFAVAAPSWTVIVSYGVALAALGFLNPVWQTVVQAEIPPHVLARVTSYDWLLSLAAMPLGYALAPIAADAWSPSVPLVLSAVAVTVACLGTAAFPGVRRLATTRPEPEPLAANERKSAGRDGQNDRVDKIITRGWTVRAEPVDSPVASALLRDYYTEIVGRYHRRPATDAEVDQVLAEEKSEDLTLPTGLFLVGWYDDEPAGCAGVRLDALPYAEVTRVFVRPEARRRGGGVRLLAAVEEAAAAHGATTMRLDTRHDLVEARALYAGHGYREVPAYSTGPYAEHWFEKQLG